MDPSDDGEGSIYAGIQNETGEKQGFGIKLFGQESPGLEAHNAFIAPYNSVRCAVGSVL